MRWVFGKTPPSTSPTRRQDTSAGLLFCSAQATSQHLQPTHLDMSKWNRYCWPSSSGISGISGDMPESPRAARDCSVVAPRIVNGFSACRLDVAAVCIQAVQFLSVCNADAPDPSRLSLEGMPSRIADRIRGTGKRRAGSSLSQSVRRSRIYEDRTSRTAWIPRYSGRTRQCAVGRSVTKLACPNRDLKQKILIV